MASGEELEFKVGDTVIIEGRLGYDSYGSSFGQTIEPRETVITRVNPGSPFPYNTEGDLGWMSVDSVRSADPESTRIDAAPIAEGAVGGAAAGAVGGTEQRVYGREETDKLEVLLNELSKYPPKIDAGIDEMLSIMNHHQIQLWINNEEGMQSVRTEVQRNTENMSELIDITNQMIQCGRDMIASNRQRMSNIVRE